MATKRLKGFGWFVCGVLVAPPCYLVSSWVAAERARVETLERSILTARRDIRDLETEFQTRANLAQLERWNGDVLALAAPRPDQYVASEEALAQLHFGPAGEGAVRPASYIVPAGYAQNTIPPVVPAAAVAGAPAPAAAQPKPAAAPAEPARRAPAPVALAAAAPATPARAMVTTKPAKPVRKAQAVAMLDSALLSDTTLGDLARGARAERTVKR
ncbi:hypothetical protein [Sphingomonas yantingensis]|uniref:Pyruvate/2-oxoglutarate dehydrogenase complex dihydrolipoamide acyltransferase (E2) component n=1 Tax=Sphingomonas yantingensis TaxID=1241761 RepID=A0A7W9ANK2_9SPHN|nr:hypothetical protein [Sphingomonas yantingensis]MBB5697582.1 pyruvate/2-oxoglutarate dehydrogenase complex dihydrolipoamide acyltransferase (E2) component [Sphingomonas yantingensis]